MAAVMIFFAGLGIGGAGVVALIYLWTRPPFVAWPRALPAATPRAIARVRRRNRLDLRHVRSAREAGVHIERTREQLRLGPVQRFALPPDDFEEHTR